MTLIEVLMLALALSVDAFVVALAAASTGRIAGRRATFRISFHFGLFQFLMPLIGWLAGVGVAPLIASVDHWIAFGLLVFIGLRMISSASKFEQAKDRGDPSRGVRLMALSVATSIDAFAVGLTLAIIGVSIWWPSVAIGFITGSVCVFAVVLGNRLHVRFGKTAEAIGGAVLIVIAIRILISHLST